MSNTCIEIDMLTELSDEQQENIAGGHLGGSLPSLGLSAPSGLSGLGLMGSPLFFGGLPGLGTHDDEDCQKTVEQDGDTQIVRIICQKTKKTP